jgi:hypothetical protein
MISTDRLFAMLFLLMRTGFYYIFIYIIYIYEYLILASTVYNGGQLHNAQITSFYPITERRPVSFLFYAGTCPAAHS